MDVGDAGRCGEIRGGAHLEVAVDDTTLVDMLEALADLHKTLHAARHAHPAHPAVRALVGCHAAADGCNAGVGAAGEGERVALLEVVLESVGLAKLHLDQQRLSV